MKNKIRINQFTKEEILNLAKNASSKSDLLSEMGFCHGGGSHKSLKQHLNFLQIKDEDLLFIRKRSICSGPIEKAYSLEELFCDQTIASSSALKRLLKRNHLIPYYCIICKLKPQWQDEPLSLQLDHINGNNKDWRLENIRWLCPNCHTQTPTWGFKKREKQAYKRKHLMDGETFTKTS